MKTPEKTEDAKNGDNPLNNSGSRSKTGLARVREEQNREEQMKRKDDDVVPKNGGGVTPYQSWRKQVDGLSKNQLFREMVCMRSGYSVLLNKHFDTALEEFKKHIVLLGKEEKMNSQEEVRSYFTFYTQAGQRTSQELHMLLQGLEKQQSAAAPPDPYRYEQLVDGRRTYLGCPIPDGAPPRPDNTAFWNETETLLWHLNHDDTLPEDPLLAVALANPEYVTALDDGWYLLLGIVCDNGQGIYLVFPDTTVITQLQNLIEALNHE